MRIRTLMLAAAAFAIGLPTLRAQTFDFKVGRNGGDGTSGAGPGEFSNPTCVMTDPDGLIFVCDTSNHRIQVFDAAGSFLRQIGSGIEGNVQGMGLANQFNAPRGLALDADGSLFVADTFNHQIVKCDATDTCVLFAGKGFADSIDGVGASAGFTSPVGLAFDGAGNLYVADTGNHAVRACDSAASCTTVAGAMRLRGLADGFSNQARFNQPTGVAFSPTGQLLIADALNHSIRQFDPASGLVTTILGNGTAGNSAGSGDAARFDMPRGVDTDEWENLYVADTGNDRIAVYRPDATFRMEFGTTGTADGELRDPYGLWIDPGHIYVAERSNNRLQVFLRDTPPPSTECVDDASAAIAAARDYQKATRLMAHECGRQQGSECLALLQEQGGLFESLATLQGLIQSACWP